MKQSMLMVVALSSVASAEDFAADDLQLSLLQVSAKPHKTSTTTEQTPMDYIGCFVDDGNRDLNQGPKNYGYTSESCKVACQSFTYFALQNNGWCVCDNQYSKAPQYRKVGDNECGGVCAGDAGLEPARYCGAGWRNAVYGVADLVEEEPEPVEEPVEDDVAAAEGDPHLSHGGIHEDLCCDGEGANRVCQPCSQDLYSVGEDQRPENMCRSGISVINICYDRRCGSTGQRPGGRNCAALPGGANACCRSRITRTCTGPNMDRCRIAGAGSMGKMGMGKMGKMGMGKMGKMGMGKMGMGMGMDEAEAVGDPHITTISGDKADLCCEGGVCKAC